MFFFFLFRRSIVLIRKCENCYIEEGKSYLYVGYIPRPKFHLSPNPHESVTIANPGPQDPLRHHQKNLYQP